MLATKSQQFCDIRFVAFDDIYLDYISILMEREGINEIIIAYQKAESGNKIISDPVVSHELHSFIFSILEMKGWLKGLPKLNPPLMVKFYYHGGQLVADAKNVPLISMKG